MTIQGSGPISVSDVSTEIGQAPTYTASLSFLNEQVKPSVRPTVPQLSTFYNMSYYQNNTEGNCNNGNCTGDCNCGNIQCTNCYIAGGVDCVNCDPQPWLQLGANCACTYNCTTGETSYNCNCNCNCACFWSDDRLKNRQGSIVNALDIVDQLEGFFYTGNEVAASIGLDTKLDVGVSAQQVEKVFPAALGDTLQHTDIRQVRYERLVPLLIEAIKELRVELNNRSK